MAYLIESIAQELGMEFVVAVDNGLVSYKFLVDATPAGATKKVSVKISEHNDVHEATVTCTLLKDTKSERCA